ncbi:FluC/FEX family fluoride channel [Nocardioides malaquae]|uniref:FluC/FEX family fluoride channel n=1 Tax=Nocardioides malaquae TaxID=2773426 RepID=UPI0029D41940|nr:CrcB family protein [Nocardioides malaquae]
MLVAAGGAVGCLARTALEAGLGEWRTVLVGQVVANLTGAFLLGMLLALLASSRAAYAAPVTLVLGAGVLGGWTTYSGLALQVLGTGEGAGPWAGALVLVLSVVGGLLAAVAGARVAARLTRPRRGSGAHA